MLQEWWNKIVYIGRKEKFGTIEVVFYRKETAFESVGNRTVSEKRLLFPSYMGRVVESVRIAAIPPTIPPSRVLAAVLKNIKEYKVVNTTQTETLFFWGYG